eukprot:scaffold978_cov172-Ochromonas_danica.AAC.22
MSNQKKIRDLERLLKSKGDALDEEAKESILKRIEALRETKEVKQLQEVRRKHEQRYHMVKFFERKKVTRMISTLDKKVSQAEGKEQEKLQSQRQRLLEDLAYIMYYPVKMKYVALFADQEEKGQEEKGRSGKMASQARALALEAWKKDVAEGKDRVVDALEVAKQLKDENKKAGRRSASDSAKQNTHEEKNEEDGGDHSEDESESESESEESEEDEEEPQGYGKKGKTTEEKSKAINNTPSAVPASAAAAATAVTDESPEGDSFFVEEAAPEDLVVSETALPKEIDEGRGRHGQQGGRVKSARSHFQQAYQQVKQAANKRKFANHQNLRQHKGDPFSDNFSFNRNNNSRNSNGPKRRKFD